MSQHDTDQQQRNHETRGAEARKILNEQRARWRDMDIRSRAQAARDAHIEKLKTMFAGTGQ